MVLVVPKWLLAYLLGVLCGMIILETYYVFIRRAQAKQYQKEVEWDDRQADLQEIKTRNEELHAHNQRLTELAWKQLAASSEWDTITPQPSRAVSNNNTPVDLGD